MKKPTFSGHESFQCKTQWLKRGYDFVSNGNRFNDEDAVLKLGVGKNMVSSIKHWLKAFGLYAQDSSLTEIADFIFNSSTGKDPYIEDVATLWLLHYYLIRTDYASIYPIVFADFHKYRNEFERDHLQNYVRRLCFENGYQYLYNENTIRKDINVLLQNYIEPESGNYEDYSALLLDLNIVKKVSKNTYCFNGFSHTSITPEVFLFAILSEMDSMSVSFDFLLDIALAFCLTSSDVLNLIRQICDKYPKEIIFSDVAGIKQMQFKTKLAKFEVLSTYYDSRSL